MIAKLLTFHRLPGVEKLFFWQALVLLARYRLRLKTTPLAKLIRLVGKEREHQKGKNASHLSVERCRRLIQVAAAFVPFTTCLSTALAGHVLFAACDHATQLHIGVRNDATTGFEAHAWLTLDNVVILGQLADLATYQELPPILVKKET